MPGSRVGKARFLEGNDPFPPSPFLLNPVFEASTGNTVLVLQGGRAGGAWRGGRSEQPVARGRIFFLITSFAIMENRCGFTLEFHGRVGTTWHELTEVETTGMIWDSAPA